MSLAEIIAANIKNKIKVKELKTPEEAAELVIKDTKKFNVNAKEYQEGT